MTSQQSPPAVLEAPIPGQQCVVIGSKILAQDDCGRKTPLLLQRSYTVLKVLNHSIQADGASSVSLCAWHTPSSLDPDLPPLFKRARYGENCDIVVVKSRVCGGLKRDENKMTELKVLRKLPPHENVIALYDFFFTFSAPPQVHLVLGNMEGNLYQLTRTRRGRALAGGLVSSITHQIAQGLNHIHSHNYFHFNLCPENILVTSLGLYDYSIVPTAPGRKSSTTAAQRDVIVTIKISGFNLACRKGSKVEDMYAGFSWYRAPEVTLLDSDCSTPVDMWAFGAIIGELIRLQPMFPGLEGPLHVITLISEMLGAPARFSRYDLNGQPADAGQWPIGHILASKMGLAFPNTQAQPLSSLFAPTTPQSLILMIRRLLMYDPLNRLTSKQCLENPYFLETEPYRTIHPARRCA